MLINEKELIDIVNFTVKMVTAKVEGDISEDQMNQALKVRVKMQKDKSKPAIYRIYRIQRGRIEWLQ